MDAQNQVIIAGLLITSLTFTGVTSIDQVFLLRTSTTPDVVLSYGCLNTTFSYNGTICDQVLQVSCHSHPARHKSSTYKCIHNLNREKGFIKRTHSELIKLSTGFSPTIVLSLCQDQGKCKGFLTRVYEVGVFTNISVQNENPPAEIITCDGARLNLSDAFFINSEKHLIGKIPYVCFVEPTTEDYVLVSIQCNRRLNIQAKKYYFREGIDAIRTSLSLSIFEELKHRKHTTPPKDSLRVFYSHICFNTTVDANPLQHCCEYELPEVKIQTKFLTLVIISHFIKGAGMKSNKTVKQDVKMFNFKVGKNFKHTLAFHLNSTAVNGSKSDHNAFVLFILSLNGSNYKENCLNQSNNDTGSDINYRNGDRSHLQNRTRRAGGKLENKTIIQKHNDKNFSINGGQVKNMTGVEENFVNVISKASFLGITSAFTHFANRIGFDENLLAFLCGLVLLLTMLAIRTAFFFIRKTYIHGYRSRYSIAQENVKEPSLSDSALQDFSRDIIDEAVLDPEFGVVDDNAYEDIFNLETAEARSETVSSYVSSSTAYDSRGTNVDSNAESAVSTRNN